MPNGVYAKQKNWGASLKESSSADFAAAASGNPSPFKETGLGYFNKYPDFAAVAGNANGSLQNNATSKSNDDLYKMWLFVDAVETSWSLSGETSQGQLGRVFYPRNTTQGEFTIEGSVANQYEYDRLVHFVEHHHFSQMRPQGAKAQSLDGNNYPSIDFMLFKPGNLQTFNAFSPVYYSIVILNIEAGHERFKNFPPYVLTCKVVYDYLEERFKDTRVEDFTRQAIFGDAESPSPDTVTSVTAEGGVGNESTIHSGGGGTVPAVQSSGTVASAPGPVGAIGTPGPTPTGAGGPSGPSTPP